MAPEMKGSFPDVDDAARATIVQTARAAMAEDKLNKQLGDLTTQLSNVKKDLGTSGSDLTKIKDDLNKVRGDLQKAKTELEAVKAGSAKKGTTGTGTPDDGMPKLDGDAFGKKKNP